jgi:hypothetical protein
LVIHADSHEVRAVELTDPRHGEGEIVAKTAGIAYTQKSGSASSAVTGYDTRDVDEASMAREPPHVAP